ncbi:hypothetical protein [Micromonospora sp. CB01531]|uniref:hypothetical protein n=1 Tax=Micromonospora sp. CB01531 TaxID=1718947 RepID=UPI000938E2D5|nr:hypothetical protein [Micromonospora sp. CB01531]OKI61697.1 hypothetical protein A6A27_27895 [Micromonospora sp. CB01531]
MAHLTIAERIIQELLRTRLPLDDDELARRLDVQPRQTINQACRRLEQSRRLRRYIGTHGKIVNELLGGTLPVAAMVEQEVLPEPPAGDSAAQRRAEGVMLGLLGERLGKTLRPRRFALPDGARVEVDGADDGVTLLVEAWAHQGPPKSAQKHKILADAMRLLFVASTLPVPPRLVLCLSDEEAARHFTIARSWAATALRTFDIHVEVVELPAELRNDILSAQQRQYR